MQGTVAAESTRPVALGRLSFPPADPADKIEPFSAGVVVPFNLRDEEERGNYLEAVTVLALSSDKDRCFVRFYRTGNTAWIETDRLQ